MGIKEGTENQAYLLDFGLAYRIVDNNYRPDPKSAHEGTIEYTSTDRHIGGECYYHFKLYDHFKILQTQHLHNGQLYEAYNLQSSCNISLPQYFPFSRCITH